MIIITAAELGLDRSKHEQCDPSQKGLARLVYFFDHEPNVPIPGVTAAAGDQVSWALVQMYTTLNSRTANDAGQHEHHQDLCSGEMAYQKSDSFEIVPAVAVAGHIHMVHYCSFKAPNACHLVSISTAGDGTDWRMQCVTPVEGGERYLLNSRYNYDEKQGLS